MKKFLSTILALILVLGSIAAFPVFALNVTADNEEEFLKAVNSAESFVNVTVSGDLTISQNFEVGTSTTITVNGELALNGVVKNHGTIKGTGSLTVNMSLLNYGTVSGFSKLTNNMNVVNEGRISDIGYLLNNSSLTVTEKKTIGAIRLFENSSATSLLVIDGNMNTMGTINNNGTITINKTGEFKTADQVNNYGNIANNGGILYIKSFINKENGVFNVNVESYVTVAPDDSFENYGKFINNGDFYCTGVYSGNDIVANSGSRYFSNVRGLGGQTLGRFAYDLDGGEGSFPEASYPYMLGRNVEKVVDYQSLGLKKGGCYFIGWVDSADVKYNAGDYISMTKDDKVLKALWGEKTSTVKEPVEKIIGMSATDKTSEVVTMHFEDSSAVSNFVRLPVKLLDEAKKANPNQKVEIISDYATVTVPVDIESIIPDIDVIARLANMQRGELKLKITFSNKSGDPNLINNIHSQLKELTTLTPVFSVEFSIDNVNNESIFKFDERRQLKAPVKIKLKTNRKNSDIGKKYGLYKYAADSDKLLFVPHKKVAVHQVSWLEGEIRGTGIYVAGETTYMFADSKTNWAAEYISSALAKKLVNGVSGDAYKPDSYVTRAQFIQMMANLLGYDRYDGKEGFYSDVKASGWYYDAAGTVKSAGLIGFAQGDTFLPDEYITREEMASVISNILILYNMGNNAEKDALAPFNDSGKITPVYKEAVNNVVASGIMNGVSSDLFNPTGRTNRAQCATILIRIAIATGMIEG